MGVGMRDVLFLGVVLGGVVLTGAGLLRPLEVCFDATTQTRSRLKRTCGRLPRLWMQHFVVTGLRTGSDRPLRLPSWP